MAITLADVTPMVQDRTFQRFFLQALTPKQLFRKEAVREKAPFRLGDKHVFKRRAPMRTRITPSTPGVDPIPVSPTVEAFTVEFYQWSDTMDVQETSNYVSIADQTKQAARDLGVAAGKSMNRVARMNTWMAYESGWTVANGGYGPGTALPVLNVNGFSHYLQNGEISAVSVTNPMPVYVTITGTPTLNYVTGCTPATAGLTYGPGTLTLLNAVTVVDRAPVYSAAAPYVHRVGGGNSVDSLSGTDLLTLYDVNYAAGSMEDNDVPANEDGFYHVHVTSTDWAQLAKDTQFLQAIRAPKDHPYLGDIAYGAFGNLLFIKNTEIPRSTRIDTGDPISSLEYATLGGGAGTIPVNRAIITAGASLMEMYIDNNDLISSAGVNGKIADFEITQNGIKIMTDGIGLIMRAPIDRLMQFTSLSWKFTGGFGVPQDQLANGAARYKRAVVIQHA